MAAPKTAEKIWFWNLHGKAQGPSSLEDMELLIRDGRLLKHYLVFREGGLKWSEAAQWAELKAYFDARDALTAAAVAEAAKPAQEDKAGGPHWIVLVKEMRDDGVFFRQKGPFTVAEVQEMIRQGQVDPRDHAWTQGMTRWAPLAEVDAFAHGNHKITPSGRAALSNVAEFAPVMDVLPPPVALVPPTPVPTPVVPSPASPAPAAISQTAAIPPSAPKDFPDESVDDELTQTFEAPLEKISVPAPAPVSAAPAAPAFAPPQKFAFDLPKATLPTAVASVPSPPAPTEEDEALESTMIAASPSFPIDETTAVTPNVTSQSSALQKATQKISMPLSQPVAPPTPVAPQPQAPAAAHQEYVDNYQPSRKVKTGSRWLAPILFIGAVAGVAAVVLFPDKSGFDQFLSPKKTPAEAPVQAGFPEANTAPVALTPATPAAPVAEAPAGASQAAAPASAPEVAVAPAVSEPASAPTESLPKAAPIAVPVRNKQVQVTFDPEARVLELRGPFKKGEALRVVLSGLPGQVVGLPSLFHAFSEAPTEDRVFRVSLASKQVPDGYYRFTVSAKAAIVDDSIAISKEPTKLRGQLARQRKLSAYDQQQERKKLLGAIRSVSALIKQGQKAKTKKDLSGLEGKLKAMASKEIQAIQSARHELFFPEGWQAVAKGVNALKKAANDVKRQPASYAGELEAHAKTLRNLDGKVKAQTQFR